jgi:hypothetical protein
LILRATIGRRCVCRFFHFLNYSPLCSPNTFFLLTFQRHGDNWIWDEIFLSIFGSCLSTLMIYWSFCLWTCTLIWFWVAGFPWSICLLSVTLISALFISLAPCLCCNIVTCCLFCDLYRCMELLSVWWSSPDMRLNETPFQFLFYSFVDLK